jgi:RNA polymerase sigma-70 factor, ECF subfamily
LRQKKQMRESDEFVIERVINDDRNAYALLVDRYKDKVYSLVFGIVRNEETAKELAQDVFVKAYSGLKKFRKESGFSTWIYRIAYNTAISETRKRKTQLYSFDEQLEKASSLDLSEALETEEQLASKKALLHRALNELEAEDRLILMLYYFEEQSVEEISRSSGLSKANVKVKLFRLRNKLKDILMQIGKTELAVY